MGRGCLIFELLIWLKQPTPGSEVPRAMFNVYSVTLFIQN